jgi:hypothetical protein
MKNKRTCNQWNNHIEYYKKSGLSIKRYCIENSLAPSTFCYWLKKSRNGICQPENKSIKLIKVSVPVKADLKMKLHYNDVTVEFPAEFPSEKISKLICALKEV